MESFTLIEVAQGTAVFVAVLGGVVYALKKNGKITFGNSRERRSLPDVCSAHTGLVEVIKQNKQVLKESIDLNREETKLVSRRLDTIQQDLATAVGWIKAKTGGNL